MLQIFRNNQFFTALFVIFYFAIFGINIWLYPNTNIADFQHLPSTFSAAILEWISNPIVNKICFSILLLIQAFILNSIVNYFKLSRHQSFVPSICLVLLHFTYVDIDSCSPVLIANTFLLWALYSLFASYDKKVELGTIFNAGFAVAVAALFYHSHVVYFIWVLMGLLIVRSFDPQEFIILIGGFFVPFFLLGSYHFLGENLGNWLQNDIKVHYNTMNFHVLANTQLYILLGILGCSYFLAVSNLQGLYFKTTSKEKKFITAVFLMPVIGVLSFLVQSNVYSIHYLTFFVPISILLSISLQSYKSIAFSEAVHFIIFMLCLGVQYQAFFFG